MLFLSFYNLNESISGDGERENVFLRQNCLAARNVHRYCLNKQDMLFQLSVPVLCVCFYFSTLTYLLHLKTLCIQTVQTCNCTSFFALVTMLLPWKIE